MLKRLLPLLIFVLGLQTILPAQDPHFSQFYASPLTLNPALTGVFGGNYRFTGIFRSQWHEVLRGEEVPMFRTFSGSFDIRTKRGFSGNDAFGVGLTFLSDKAGELEYGTNGVGLSISYLKALNERSTHYVTVGFQAGITQRSINTANARTGVGYEGGGVYNPLIDFDPGLAAADDNFIFYDMSAGLLWYTKPRERFDVYAGASIYHLNRPLESFLGDNGTDAPRVPMKIGFHTGVHVPLAGQIDLLPKLIVLMQGENFEMNFGTEVKLFFEQRNPEGNAFYAGLLYRIVGGDKDFLGDEAINTEAIIFTGKIDYSSFTFGVAYDVNLSELIDASFSKGGWEVSVAHVGAFKDKRPKTMYCPKF